MLREIDTGIWATEAPQRFLGAEVGTRMTVIGLADGSLFVHSPVRLDDENDCFQSDFSTAAKRRMPSVICFSGSDA